MAGPILRRTDQKPTAIAFEHVAGPIPWNGGVREALNDVSLGSDQRSRLLASLEPAKNRTTASEWR